MSDAERNVVILLVFGALAVGLFAGYHGGLCAGGCYRPATACQGGQTMDGKVTTIDKTGG